MAIDEFGREIPAQRSPPRHRSRSRSRSRSPRRDISTMRYEEMGRPSYRRSPSREYRRRSRSQSPKRKRSASPDRRKRRRRHHPVENYVESPLLCEYLWEKESKGKEDKDGPLEKDREEEEKETFENYKKKYCLDFIRSFFNAHLDDEWFRMRYSPLYRKKQVLALRERSVTEANTIRDSLSSGDGAEKFLSEARLGIGKKPTGNNNRRRGRDDEKIDDKNDNEDETDCKNAVPMSHMLPGLVTSVKITEIPSHMTDQQIQQSVADHAPNAPFRICSTSVGLGESIVNPKYCNSLVRMAYIVFSTKEAKEEFIESLARANYEADRAPSAHSSSTRKIPTKRPPIPKSLELDVECSDTFNRTDVDSDGKGSAQTEPPYGKVQVKKSPVVINPLLNHIEKQSLVVLSAALSSVERIGRDKTAALMIARALDTSSQIPQGVRLDDLLDMIFEEREKREEDVLDVAIAYLRRVHLFSFYNAQAATSEGDVMAGFHPAGSIHLRLRDADKILDKIDESNPAQEQEENKSDLLVMRLDESISKALEETTAKIAGKDVIVNEGIDLLAEEIQREEEKAKKLWLHNHALLDADGRARCSFHFCRKLFKDKTFLNKHLMKKHPEYLVAEQAKCHDPFMMTTWEKEEVRPIPQILVDCGTRFGLVPVSVTGSEPNVIDPEPELFQKEEEQMKRMQEDRERRDHSYQRNYHKREYPPENTFNNDAPQTNPTGFVDVDDMKDEKVELSFENVDVPLPPKKKKKKKKKLL